MTAVIIGTLAAMLWTLDRHEAERARISRSIELGLVNSEIATAFDQAGRFALALAETTARRSAVRAAMENADRAELIRQTEDIYGFLKQQTGVRLFGFHDRDLRYFLRLHKPEEFGDDISATRPMIVAVNRGRKAQVGMEIGAGGLGLRAATVVEGRSGFAGTLELGLDLNPLIESVKETSNADVAVVIRHDRSAAVPDGRRPRVEDLVVAASTDDALFVTLLQDARLRSPADIIEARVDRTDRQYDVITRPLVDFSGRKIGFTLAAKEASDAAAWKLRTDLVVVALCGAILAFVVFSALYWFGRDE